VLVSVRRIEAVCAAHSIAPGAAALQFSLHDSRIASTIVGVSKPERITQTIEMDSGKDSQTGFVEPERLEVFRGRSRGQPQLFAGIVLALTHVSPVTFATRPAAPETQH
jgi:hypothetical protein